MFPANLFQSTSFASPLGEKRFPPWRNRLRRGSSPKGTRSRAMMEKGSGIRPSRYRSKRDGINLRQVRSPAPPKMTIRAGSGRTDSGLAGSGRAGPHLVGFDIVRSGLRVSFMIRFLSPIGYEKPLWNRSVRSYGKIGRASGRE